MKRAPLLLLLCFAAGCRPAPPAPAPPRPLAVRTVPVEHGELVEALHYVGTVRARREVPVVARLAGTLLELPFREGDWVKQGEVLARLYAPDAAARTRRLQAEVDRAVAEASYLCGKYRVDERLHAQGAVAKAQLDAAFRGCQSARSGQRAARAALGEGRIQQKRTAETAPFEGQVLVRHVETGQHLLPGQPLLVLGGRAREVRVPVAEADLGRGIAPGSPVRLLGHFGQVRAVAPQAFGQSRWVEVTIDLPAEASPAPSPGMSVDVAFVLHRLEAATIVPAEALVETAEGTAVFLVEEGLLQRRPVRSLARAGGRVAVEPSLPEGAQVALGGSSRLEDGAQVYPVAAEGKR